MAEAGRIRALVRLQQQRFEEGLGAAIAAREIAVEQQSRLLEGEATVACALILRSMGRAAEAEHRRVAARTIFTELGASAFLAEFDRVWDAGD
jgi:hypothetical protein